jgi:hypothetical protein
VPRHDKQHVQTRIFAVGKPDLQQLPLYHVLGFFPKDSNLAINFPHTCFREKIADDRHHDASTAAEPGAAGQHKGSASRTDNQISFEYPDEQEVPISKVVQGRGGFHMKRTLPSFSLEGKVAVVTGGARGLGLVMG